MKRRFDDGVLTSGCRCCLSRRRFLAGCAACAAGATGVARWPTRAVAAADSTKPRVRAVFSHPTPDRITWPNIGYDYDGRAKEILRQLAALCPEVELLPNTVIDKEQAQKVIDDDANVDGYLIYVLGIGGNGAMVVDAVGKAGRPMVVVEDQYAGPYSLGFNGRAQKAGWKAVCLASTRMEDIAAAVRCFRVLKTPGATPDNFLTAAKAVYQKAIGPMGDMACAEDHVEARPVQQCLDKLRQSTILLVGREPGPEGKAIEKVFGTQVVPLKLAELDEAFKRADPDQAARWADAWSKAAEKIVEPTREDILKSGAFHVAMQEVMKKHNAQAISINCLGGFYSGQLQAFPCLGFVELNNQGLVGACEGDQRSTITMLAMSYLVGRPGFISDPVVDLAKHQVIYAHCVAPTKVFGPQGTANAYHIRSHSEDRRGAAVRSLLPLGYMTTTLEFLPSRREVLFHQGKSVANIDEDKACRTKLAVDLKGDLDRLFTHWGHGWHRVTYYGDLKEPVEQLCKALDLTLIEEAAS